MTRGPDTGEVSFEMHPGTPADIGNLRESGYEVVDHVPTDDSQGNGEADPETPWKTGLLAVGEIQDRAQDRITQPFALHPLASENDGKAGRGHKEGCDQRHPRGEGDVPDLPGNVHAGGAAFEQVVQRVVDVAGRQPLGNIGVEELAPLVFRCREIVRRCDGAQEIALSVRRKGWRRQPGRRPE